MPHEVWPCISEVDYVGAIENFRGHPRNPRGWQSGNRPYNNIRLNLLPVPNERENLRKSNQELASSLRRNRIAYPVRGTTEDSLAFCPFIRHLPRLRTVTHGVDRTTVPWWRCNHANFVPGIDEHFCKPRPTSLRHSIFWVPILGDEKNTHVLATSV